ncbi:STAS domain-containing protein [Actinomadura chokoriensis]|uniref:STAS domain-containing protein n=1 Tax=Actinomadura chokoriensis TaxID=454156 RepID=UPI0031F8BFE6
MTPANDHPSTSASRPGGPAASTTVSYAGGALLVAVDVRPHDSTAELRLRGELDAAASEDLRRHIGAVIDRHDPDRLLLDLSEAAVRRRPPGSRRPHA